MSKYHTPALLQEVVQFLNIKKGEKYIDATLGGGGHTFAIAEAGGMVLGIDQDEDAIDYVRNQELGIRNQEEGRLILTRGNFRNIAEIAKKNGFENVAGILFDLGVSSHQLDTKERGFSFLQEGLLDMRMDRSEGVPAADLVNGMSKYELEFIFKKFGEEPWASAIARSIVEKRKEQPITSTKELSMIVEKVTGRNYEMHPATRVFQALRIAVNDELQALKEGLEGAVSLLSSRGRMVVLSFHSLEDRIVKEAMKNFEKRTTGTCITPKPITPTGREIEENPRARSVKMRVFEKN